MLKKLMLVMVVASLCSVAYASSENDDWDSEMGLVLGPKFNVKNSTTQFTVGLLGGGKYLKYGINYSHYSVLGVGINAFKPYFLIEIPFGFDVGSKGEILIGPMVDLGPEFAFGGGVKGIDVIQVGYGFFVKYYFNDSIGIGMTPFHMTNSFAYYQTGGAGFNKLSRMTYDLLFSVLFRW